MTILVTAMAVVLALVVVLVAGLLRSHADILRALHSLGITEDELRGNGGAGGTTTRPRTPTGVPEPRAEEDLDGAGHDITGKTPAGGVLHVGVVGVAHTTLLAFLSSNCLTCRDFWEAFSTAPRLPGHDTRLVIVTQGHEAESPSAVAALAPRDITVVMSSAAWSDYAVPVSPYFLLVDGPSGNVLGEGAAASWDKVAELLGRAVGDRGVATDAAAGPARTVHRSGPEREADTDAELRAAGIEPGDDRLHHGPRSKP
ncbi:MAG: hypothetical protein ACE367_07880 [Acidimicrobiales bacterium]